MGCLLWLTLIALLLVIGATFGPFTVALILIALFIKIR